MSTKKIGGIFRGEMPDQQWILQWPEPLGVSFHPTLREAKQAARKAKLSPKRWYGCDVEVAA
jgi:hypothetical protein